MNTYLDLRAKTLVRDIPDFPKKGIIFKDITPVLADIEAMREVLDRLEELARPLRVNSIVGIESRGFLLGMPLADRLGVGFIPIRKVGKLPHKTIEEHYDLEYGTNTLQIHSDAIKPGERVLLVDDLLATGGTARASIRLIERLEGHVAAVAFLIELDFLNGRDHLGGKPVISLIHY